MSIGEQTLKDAIEKPSATAEAIVNQFLKSNDASLKNLGVLIQLLGKFKSGGDLLARVKLTMLADNTIIINVFENPTGPLIATFEEQFNESFPSDALVAKLMLIL